jgi:hypothetical protein
VSSAICILAVLIGVAIPIFGAVMKQSAGKVNEDKLLEIGEIVSRVGNVAALYLDPPRIAVANAAPVDPKLSENMQNFFRESAHHEYKVYPITARLSASVEVVGGINTVRGRNLGTKAAAGLATGGLGFFVVGNAKKESVDTREAFLTFISDEWSHVEQVSGPYVLQSRQFVAQVSQIVRTLSS